MKIIDFFKGSRPAKIGGITLFCSVMVLTAALSLGSLTDSALYPAFSSALDWVAEISGATAAVGAGILEFAVLRRKFGAANSVFIVLFSFEAVGLLAGIIIYLVSLNPQNPLFSMGNAMSFYYYFLGILISAASLLCAIATSVVFALWSILKKIMKTTGIR